MTPYLSFSYFAVLLLFLVPAALLGFWGRGLRGYAFFLNFVFIWLVYGHQPEQMFALIIYVLLQWIVLTFYQQFKQKTWAYYFSLLLSLTPPILIKIVPALSPQSVIGFLGISYLTFKNVQILIEIRDKLIQEIQPFDFLDFILFFPTISSGPIDRFRRYQQDQQEQAGGRAYSAYLAFGLHRIFQGFLYKYILAYLIHKYWLPAKFLHTAPVSHWVEQSYQYEFHHFFTLSAYQSFLTGLSYMYAYSFYLFFDFAGYSAFAIGVSYILGIKTPENFNLPFISRNIKDFWNRWHMTLSFWFRDFVFMRVVLLLSRKKVLRSRQLTAYAGYIALFGLMGFWHGIAWHYIAYGFYQAFLFIGYDLFDRLNKKAQFWKNNRIFHVISILITFHFVCFGFLIFSGYLF